MENRKLRIHLGSFDLLKGVGMLLVIVGHMSFFYDLEQMPLLQPLVLLLKMTGPALMPMFFIISGYGFHEKSPGKMLRLTVSGLLVPYLWVAGFFTAIYPAAHFFRSGSIVESVWIAVRYALAFLLGIPETGKVILGFEVMHCAAVWFFLATFVAFNLLNLLLKLKKPALRAGLVCLCVVAGYLLAVRDVNYFCIAQGLMATGCCYMGFLLKKYDLLSRWMRSVWAYCLLVPVAAVYMCFGHMNLSLGEFRFGFLDFTGACATAVLFLFVGLFVGQKDWKGLDWLKHIGMYTYWILCVHVVEDGCMQWDLLIRAMPSPYLAFAVELLLKGLIIMAACVVLKKIAQRRYRRRRISGANERLC